MKDKAGIQELIEANLREDGFKLREPQPSEIFEAVMHSMAINSKAVEAGGGSMLAVIMLPSVDPEEGTAMHVIQLDDRRFGNDCIDAMKAVLASVESEIQR